MTTVTQLPPLPFSPSLPDQVCGLPAGWAVVGFSKAEIPSVSESSLQDLVARAEVVESCAAILRAGVDAVAVLSPDVTALFASSSARLLQEAARDDSWVTVLLPWQEAPTRSIRADGVARSFCCSAGVYGELLKIVDRVEAESLCFHLLDAILNGEVAVAALRVRQLPLHEASSSRPVVGQSAAVIMAHRGAKRFLESALQSIMGAAGASQLVVRVGLDVEDAREYQDMVEAFPEAEFYGVAGAPAGPYVVRQALIDRSRERLIVFHDSDDFSCHDRFATQAAEIASTGVGVMGSHEIRVDELSGRVEVYRFPLDASAALAMPGATERNDRANEPLLHPTLTMVRSGFVEAGGFSTNRKIANDTQFMLRAYFSMRMRNADHFLYIRRRHAAALTVAKETALGTPLRHYLGTMWGADFEAVRSGKARLEETSLRPRLSTAAHPLTRLWPVAAAEFKRPA